MNGTIRSLVQRTPRCSGLDFAGMRQTGVRVSIKSFKVNCIESSFDQTELSQSEMNQSGSVEILANVNKIWPMTN